MKYAYDTGAANAHEWLASVTNSAATDTILDYDELGRVTGSRQAVTGGSSGTFNYTHNLADALVQTSEPTVTNA